MSNRGEERGRTARVLPGPNGVLFPASPPGFVAALSTARSRDAPAEKLDERLPRRLPLLDLLPGSPGACSNSLHPASPDHRVGPTGRTSRRISLSHLLWQNRNQLTLTAAAEKRNPGPQKRPRSTTPSAASRTTITGWWTR